MRVDAATRGDIAYVARDMRERDFLEISAVTPCDTREHLAALLAADFGGHPLTVVAGDEIEPIAVAGIVEQRPNVGTLMFFATDRWPVIGPAFTRFIVRRAFPAYWDRGAHRLECMSIEGYDEVHRWLRVLGLNREARMPGYGKRGEAFIQFAKVRSRAH